MHKIKLEEFEGPLDLLLQLIEEEELDISQVSLAQMAEQYLEYLNQSSELNPEELADFLVVATKLLVIKSRLLLPHLKLEEEEGPSLEDQLKIYREYLEASKIIYQFISEKKFAWSRERSFFKEIVFRPPQNINLTRLNQVFKEILTGLRPLIDLPRATLQKTISLQEKIKQIRNLIINQSSLSFNTLLQGVSDKTEVIVSFLALLELVKQKVIIVVQERRFEKIVIKRNLINNN